jgi:uncharacterized protein YndB with AHSA1/START domain
MASIRRETVIDAAPDLVWDALRDVGAIHERLAPGFVTDVKLEPGARLVSFGNGMVVRERIVAVDEAERRVVCPRPAGGSSTTTPRRRCSTRARAGAASSGSRTSCPTPSRRPSPR